MSYQPVLGPYQFATTDENLDCGCNANYCTPFINGDFLAFQVPSSYSCCEFLDGCDELNASCVASSSLTSDLSFIQATANISFTNEPFVANDWILQGNAIFAASTKYVICFCLTGHTSFTTVKAKIGTTESAITITGNGNYCLTVDPAYGAPTAADWGIIVTGGDATFTAVLSCLRVCSYRSFSANLVDSTGSVVAGLTRNEGENGNQIFEFALNIPGEIAEGCYNIELTEDCGTTTYVSQCLKMLESMPCADAPNIQLKWRNRNNAFGFDYTTIAGYYNMIRVKGRLKHPTFPDDTQIELFSDNQNAVINARVQKLWKVVLNDLPEYVHSTIATARRHSDFQIDGVGFVVADGAYAPEWRKSSELAVVTFEAFDQSFDGVSTYC